MRWLTKIYPFQAHMNYPYPDLHSVIICSLSIWIMSCTLTWVENSITRAYRGTNPNTPDVNREGGSGEIARCFQCMHGSQDY
ncbi:uncharacterized protein K441DRAFT_325938 [Cenococcum geophilum 1.58]|uniref:Uncharacterized protein n=1 Tax=Cenococcum geophilum 1.58 TaxID=794803 RepID=A0ACC8EP79_9PEZI|nr:hypothetical protein K441DRAFT_325938 [Cenococcum geophilum 1.58]